MKKILLYFLCAVMLLSLCACSQDAALSAADGPEALAFPGLSWNATPEQVCEVLGVDMADLVQYEEEDPVARTLVLGAPGVKAFGVDSLNMLLHFRDYTPDEEARLGLAAVQIYFPDGCDVAAIEKALVDAYGPAVAENYTSQYNPVEGQVVRTPIEEGSKVWQSSMTLGELLSDAGKEAYRADICGREVYPATQEGYEASLGNSVSSIGWFPNYTYVDEVFPPEEFPENVSHVYLHLNADELVYNIQTYEG